MVVGAVEVVMKLSADRETHPSLIILKYCVGYRLFTLHCSLLYPQVATKRLNQLWRQNYFIRLFSSCKGLVIEMIAFKRNSSKLGGRIHVHIGTHSVTSS